MLKALGTTRKLPTNSLVFLKLLDRLLYNRIVPEIDKMTPPEQAGLTKNRVTSDGALLPSDQQRGTQRIRCDVRRGTVDV